ncbi:unnamed protein product [Schistosoma margrebowiei]|uniref:Uncharacterized protein n=1 Tax=Schistosoma margrebowiei TaxID=48269 RepID=A0A3P8B4H8_9TREM|nr:unnamed protein product [Schistosoma margrebowiei]
MGHCFPFFFLFPFSILFTFRVLDHSTTKDNRHNEFIYIEFKQDALLDKKIQINLRSIHLCASMDYLMSLLDFQMKSTPILKSESNNLTSVSDKSKQKRLNNSSTTKTGRYNNFLIF